MALLYHENNWNGFYASSTLKHCEYLERWLDDLCVVTVKRKSSLSTELLKFISKIKYCIFQMASEIKSSYSNC